LVLYAEKRVEALRRKFEFSEFAQMLYPVDLINRGY
jgi:hypothetical protein